VGPPSSLSRFNFLISALNDLRRPVVLHSLGDRPFLTSMPFVTHNNQRIHYSAHGSGPTVLLQHGLLSHGRRFKDLGYLKALGQYQVVCIDSLGHGKSDKPIFAEPYARSERVRQVCHVLDALNIERAHFVGYSMGAWIGVGMAVDAPNRLASLTLGGWDPIQGPAQGYATGAQGTAQLLSEARQKYPGLVDWITPEIEPCIAACLNALEDNDGALQALKNLARPPLFWCGVEDACFSRVKGLSETLGARLHRPEANHVTAIVRGVAKTAEFLREHFEDSKIAPGE